jgi:glutathione synthase/RimK-type ligase-like ATP-grasp enzyme
MHLALASCTKLPEWEADDVPFRAALAKRGVQVTQPAWDDDAVAWSAFDGVLIRTTWDYMDRRDEYVAWAKHVESVVPLFNSAGIVEWNTHKSYLRDLEAAGVPIVPTIWLNRGATPNLAQELGGRAWAHGFIKPAVGATARETMRFEACDGELDAARSHLERMLAVEDMLLQPYLPSVETEGEFSAIFIAGELTHVVRKIPVRGDYRVQDDFGGADEPWEFTPDELSLAQRALGAAGEDLLYARTDFLRDADGGLLMTEFEAVEPSLFFRHAPHAAERLADEVIARVEIAQNAISHRP